MVPASARRGWSITRVTNTKSQPRLPGSAPHCNTGTEDLAAAEHVYARARAEGAGTTVPF